MRKITLFSALLILGTAFSLKAQLDVGCTGLPNHPNGTMVYPNVPEQIQYQRTNFGPAVTSADVDSFTMEIYVNLVKRQTFYRNMSASFGVNATETNQGVNPLDWSTLGLSAGNNSLCVKTMLWKNGSNVDVNANNDETCVTVVYSGDNNPLMHDLSVVDVTISDPALAPGDFVHSSTFMSELQFFLKNEGTNQLPAGIDFEVMVDVDGTVTGPIPGVSGALSSGGSIPYTINAAATGIFLPTEGGPFDICIELVSDPNDPDHSNDEGCVMYNSTIGIEEAAEKSSFKMYAYNNILFVNMLEGTAGAYNLSLISVTGQAVQTSVLNANDNKLHSIDLGVINPGMYIANISNDKGEFESIRVMVE